MMKIKTTALLIVITLILLTGCDVLSFLEYTKKDKPSGTVTENELPGIVTGVTADNERRSI